MSGVYLKRMDIRYSHTSLWQSRRDRTFYFKI